MLAVEVGEERVEDGGGLVPMETVQSAHLYVLCAVLSHWHPAASLHHSWT